MMTVTAFRWVPPFAQGLVRDLRVRWALEEAGLPYHVRLIDGDIQGSDEYRSHQPFGQVPVLHDGDLTLFESGAIALHIAERSSILLPSDHHARARAKAWLFAALNSVETAVQPLAEIDLFAPEEAWAKAHRPEVLAALNTRLSDLTKALGARDYLESEFTVADLMMSTVLRILRHCDVLDGHTALKAYRERCEARPAFQRALAGQMGDFAPA